MEDLKVSIDGKEYVVKVEKQDSGKLKVFFEGETFEVETQTDIKRQLFEETSKKDSDKEKGIVTAPLPGIIFSIDVKVGDAVKKGQKLISLMAMKMENEIIAPIDGKIREIKVKKEDTVDKGDVLLTID
jgi:biotin carboxyl carrier protein